MGMKKNLLLAGLLAAATSAYAGDFYIVGSVGSAKAKVDQSSINNDLRAVGLTVVSSSVDERDTGYKLQLGYQITPNIAVEGGYVNLGKAKYSSTVSNGSANATVNADWKSDGWNIAVLGIAPITDAFSVFGKLGTIDAKVSLSASASGPGGTFSASDSASKWKGNYGLGAAYNFNKQLAVRAEYEVFSKLGDDNVGKSDVDLLSIGLSYKF